MKVKIIKEACSKKKMLSENVDDDYLKQQGIILLSELGSGMFGTVYEIIADVGDGDGRYALKYIDSTSQGYARERANYKNIKNFVELANIRQDAEAVQLSKILPVIYSVSEYPNAAGGLYIIMEKLIPLSDSEEKLFMSEITGLAYQYSRHQHRGAAKDLVNHITDRDGKVGISFGSERVLFVLKSISGSDEYNHIKGKEQKLISLVLNRNNGNQHATILFDAWKSSGFYDDLKSDVIEELYDLNEDFKIFLNGIGKVLITQYRDPQNPDDRITDDPSLAGLLMNSIFDMIFAQKYPMKYTDKPNIESPYNTGYGQTSSIYDLDIPPNPKLKEQKKDYSAGVGSNPAQPAPSKIEPKKYPFDAIISAIKRLGRDWNIKAKDMHYANVMKRADGQFVIADIGLFNTKTIQSLKSGIFESIKRKIKVKII